MDLIVNEELISRILQGGEIEDPFAVAAHRKQARAAVGFAILAGVLSRPLECPACGSLCKTEAHHDDYDRPLDVQWLCKRCHARADRARRLRNEQRPVGDHFAAFLLVNGGVELPPRDDPPYDFGQNGDCVDRAIRSLHFAGFTGAKQGTRRILCAVVRAVLSCGHEKLLYASELAELPTYRICPQCTDTQRLKRRDRLERRRARRAAKSSDWLKAWGGVL